MADQIVDQLVEIQESGLVYRLRNRAELAEAQVSTLTAQRDALVAAIEEAVSDLRYDDRMLLVRIRLERALADAARQ